MTIKPVAYKTRLAGTVGRLEVPSPDVEIDDAVAFVVVGTVKARNEAGTDAGPVLTIGVKADDFHVLPAALADDLILSVKRHGRAATLKLDGNVSLSEADDVDLDPSDALNLGESPEEVVDRWLAGASDEVDSDEVEAGNTADADADLELFAEDEDEDPAGDPMPRRDVDLGDDAAYLQRLEAAWSYIDSASPGYADQTEAERRARALGQKSAPWVLRNFLLLEVDELAGSEVFIRALEDAHREALQRVQGSEPWEGFAKATVDAIVGRLDSRKTSDEAAGNREAVLEHVELYELSHKGRKGVLTAIAEERLGHGPEATLDDPVAGDFEPEPILEDEADR